MSSTSFETEGPSSGRRLYIWVCYTVFYIHRYKWIPNTIFYLPKRLLILMHVKHTIPVMGKLFKEGAKGKEKNFRRANIIY